MNKIILNKNKVLKLSNVLGMAIQVDKSNNFNINIEQMQNYLKRSGAVSIGPLIQYVSTFVNENGELDIEIKLLLQSNYYIKNVQPPYQMERVICVKNCMYVRYQGEENKLKFAYDKINLTAFEEDIPLKGDSYTIFVDQQDDQIIADVFMERADYD